MPDMEDPQPVAPDVSRGQRLTSLLVRLDVHRRLAEQQAQLRPAEGRLLWLLSDRRPRTLREIADSLHLEQSTVNRQVNGALQAGLVRRTVEPGRSAKLIEPTGEGLAAYDAAVATVFGACETALRALDVDDTSPFLHLLERLVDAYGDAVAAQSAGGPRPE